jgi:RNA polymerase sigma-70 factor, ECF subfamily
MSDPCTDRGDDDGRNSKDVELVRRALVCDADAFQTIMQMHNQRLYRIARGLADDDSEAEDIVQEAYVSRFRPLCRVSGTAGSSSTRRWDA